MRRPRRRRGAQPAPGAPVGPAADDVAATRGGGPGDSADDGTSASSAAPGVHGTPADRHPFPAGNTGDDAAPPVDDEKRPPGDAPLTASHVWLAYRAMLGRTPGEAEIAHQLAVLGTPEELLALILSSDEYAFKNPPEATAAVRPSTVNWWHPDAAAHTHPPGTLSPDAVAVVGREGVLFLHGGTNSILDQFVGDVTMDDAWAEGWASLMHHRAEAMSAGGRLAASVVVPDKLAVYRELFPTPLRRGAPRPVERLLGELALPLLYPVEPMRAARRDGPVYLLTDTHLSFRGNHALYVAIMDELGVDPLPLEGLAELHPQTASGDLGSRFDPQIVEIARIATTMGAARITEDNREAVERGGGHIGSRRVYRNDTAPDPRCVVLYGDSYGFGSTAYQGLSWFLAQTFADVHFVWTPFGWDPEHAERVGADIVISETAERFVPRVPSLAIDVEAICAAAVSRGAAVSPDAVFSDRPDGG